MNAPDTTHVGIEPAAHISGCHSRTIRRAILNCKLPATVDERGAYQILLGDLRDLIEADLIEHIRRVAPALRQDQREHIAALVRDVSRWNAA